MLPLPLVPVPLNAVVHVLFEYLAQLTLESVGPLERNLRFASVKLVVAAPELATGRNNAVGGYEPVRERELVGDLAGRIRDDVDMAIPSGAQVVVHEDVHTLSPACQFAPVSVTVPPGG